MSKGRRLACLWFLALIFLHLFVYSVSIPALLSVFLPLLAYVTWRYTRVRNVPIWIHVALMVAFYSVAILGCLSIVTASIAWAWSAWWGGASSPSTPRFSGPFVPVEKLVVTPFDEPPMPDYTGVLDTHA
jgi:hypothetical protein